MRHRHVLALREDSGWTYQQIADHEGVEIGTIETLLWRARQALKREFLALSESKGSFAGFLLGAAATIRTVVVRSAHRAAALQPGASGGAFRNAFAGFAVTSAVAAAFIAPHALDSSHQAQVPLPAPAAASAAATSGASGTRLDAASVTPNAGSASGGGSTTLSGAHLQGGSSNSAGAGTVAGADRSLDSSGSALLSGASKSAAPVRALAAPAQSLLPQELLEPVTSGASSLLSRTAAAATAAASGSASSVTSLVPAAAGAISSTAAGVSSAVGSVAGSALGSGSATPQAGAPVSSPATTATPKSTTTTTTAPLSGIASLTPNVFSALLGNG